MSNVIPLRPEHPEHDHPGVGAVLDTVTGLVSISIAGVATEMTHAELAALRDRLGEWEAKGLIPERSRE